MLQQNTTQFLQFSTRTHSKYAQKRREPRRACTTTRDCASLAVCVRAHVPPHVTVPLCAHVGKGSCLHCITHCTNNHFFCAVFLFCFIRVSVKTRKRHTTDVSGKEVRSLATTRKGLSAQSNLRYKLFSLTSES